MLTWLGVSWRTASSGRRAALRELDALIPDGVAIHTCARDAWLVDGDGSAHTDALAARGFSAHELDSRSDRAAVDRLLAVAVGLDSAVQGEADVGRQVRAALDVGNTRVIAVLDHVLARLLRQGRLEGWVREGHGVASLAVRAVEGHARVGVVGAGLVGAQVARALGARGRFYNRTPRPGTQSLATLEPADAWIVATSAVSAWFRPPEPYRLLIDLGHPAQAIDDSRRVSLDALLTGADARLDPALLHAAQLAVRCATDDVFERLARRIASDDRVSA